MIKAKHALDPQEATTPVDGMDITEMLLNKNYTSLELCKEAANEIAWLRTKVKEQQECDAALIEKMIGDGPWKDHLMARGALTLAAHVIRRGRHLTAKEKLENLRKALDDVAF